VSSPTKSPTARWLTRGLLAAHIAAATAYCIPLVLGATSGTTVTPAAASTEPCPEAAASLLEAVTRRSAEVPRSTIGVVEYRAFEAFSGPTRARLAELQGRCPAERPALAAIERLLAASEIHAASWSRHVGPLADEARRAVSQLAR